MRKLMIGILLAACMLALAGCMAQPVDFDIPPAAKIVLQSGNTGNSVDVTDSEAIQFITANFTEVQYQKGNYAGDSSGWSYQITWYDEDGELVESITVMSASRIQYEDWFYSTIGAGIDTKYLDGLLGEG